MVSETPLVNGFKMHLLDSLSFSNHLKDARVSSTEEHEVKTNDVDDVVDVALLNVSQDFITEDEESSSCISPKASLSFHDTVKASENIEQLTDIQLNAVDNDKVLPDECTRTEELAGEPSSCLNSGSPILADLGESQLSPKRKIQPISATEESRESENEIANEVLSESSDDAKDGLKFTADLASTCSSEHSLNVSSNLETSGIQSNLTSFEDSFGHLSNFSENGTIMQTSDEEAEPCFQFDVHLPSVHAKSCSAESTSHG